MKYYFLLLLLLRITATSAGQENKLSTSRDFSIHHPFLLIDSARISKIQEEIVASEWKKKSWLELKNTADLFVKEELVIPPRGGNWELFYINPKNGNQLTRGKQISDWKWEHEDIVTKEKFLGDTSEIKKDLDGVIISLIHDIWAIGSLQLGLAYQISRDKIYAEKAKQILLAYATIYPKLPERSRDSDQSKTINTGRGRVHVQNLNEALWLIDLVQSADLIWETLTEKERRTICDNIFLPAVKTITLRSNWISNIQCWKNAAVGMVGFLLNDQNLIAKAMTDPIDGYFKQLEKGVTKEGMWMDRSPNYHFYALNALTQLSQAAYNYGYPIDYQALKRMFDAPILMATQTLSIPPFNDSSPLSLISESGLYEWGFSLFKDSSFVRILNRSNREKYKNSGPTYTGWGLLYGTPTLPIGKPWQTHSKLFNETGIGMLSKGNKQNNLTFYLKYNTSTSYHIHPDELAFSIFKGSENIFIFPGVTSYASILNNNWYKTSLAHNSFVINETNQLKSSRGKCIAFGTEKGSDFIISETSTAYDSARYIRTVTLLNENVVLIIDQIKLQAPPQLVDVAFHELGAWENVPKGDKWEPSATLPGYNRIKDATLTKGIEEVSLLANSRLGKKVMLNIFSNQQADLITGYGEPYLQQTTPLAIYRMKTNNAVVVSYISLNGQKVKLKTQQLEASDKMKIAESTAVKVTVEELSGKRINIIINPYKEDLFALPDSKEKHLIIE